MKLNRVLFISTAALALTLVLASCAGLQIVGPFAGDAAPQEAPMAEPVAPVVEETVAEEATEWVAPRGALVAMRAAAAPTLDGIADEAIWAEAEAIMIELEGGANAGETEVTMKSVYTDDMVYFLLSWADPTESYIRSPWLKQDDGSWLKLRDPDDRGGDNNVYYEDKMSIIWTINNSIPKFERQGCYVACHVSRGDDVKPYGNKYTDEGMGDMWHWKSVRNLNQVDDQYLDSTPWSPETPSAGRKSDPKTGGGYVDNQTEDKTMPMWMGPEGSPRDGTPGYILDSAKEPFDDSLFAAGDMVPSIIISEMIGDRGDLSAGWLWADGVWTIEIGRVLDTGSEYDVQFNDLDALYYFGVATFENAQVRHAYHDGVQVLVFEP